MIPQITNICFKGHTRCPIDIIQLYKSNEKIKMKFEHERFPGLIIHFAFGTCLIFRSGYYSICGCKTFEHGYISQLELFDLLKNNNYKIQNDELILTNICGSFDYGRQINLIKLALNNKKETYYDVEYFPGLKFTLENHVFTIHHTGKVFVTGMRSVVELNRLFNKLDDILKDYIKHTSAEI